MDNISKIRAIAKDAVKLEKEKDVPNETKKRSAIAAVNAFLVANPEFHLSDIEIDKLVEEEVLNERKQ
ncbi:hypothetical protein CI088_09575 [Enterococcus plantarum]|uniref:Uncharacterized protein n=1 Tax=Enterococcus plantarum TaxID=1077675 RepID=A0A2W3YRD7_9ENTE|nr:hypothetical protein [Enterococcus plantarum]PZL70141.1 hypothetical protein CI088_15950 [Enterococcus plantarum]PZL73107.1 hypothetical protein CI088_09575 [Enterococcus plantarum]